MSRPGRRPAPSRRAGRPRDGQWPLPDARTRALPNSDRPPTASARTDGRTSARPDEAQDVAMALDRGDRRPGRQLADLGPGPDAECRFERREVRTADHDQPEPAIPAAQGRPELLDGQRPDRRPEPDDRDDRDGGRGRRGWRAGRPGRGRRGGGRGGRFESARRRHGQACAPRMPPPPEESPPATQRATAPRPPGRSRSSRPRRS